jgi:hypothetical protein
MLGSYFSAKGTAIASEDKEKGGLYNGDGNAASFASMGAMMGPAGAGIGTVIGAIISIPSIMEAMS